MQSRKRQNFTSFLRPNQTNQQKCYNNNNKKNQLADSPSVKLELGNSMLSENLRENTDIYFECLIDAQPQVREVIWLHNEKPINESNWWSSKQQQQQQGLMRWSTSLSSSASRVILSNNSLVIQRVQLEQAGSYACMASNSEGTGISNRLELRVLRKCFCIFYFFSLLLLLLFRVSFFFSFILTLATSNSQHQNPNPVYHRQPKLTSSKRKKN